jgi:hypothetical protein
MPGCALAWHASPAVAVVGTNKTVVTENHTERQSAPASCLNTSPKESLLQDVVLSSQDVQFECFAVRLILKRGVKIGIIYNHSDELHRQRAQIFF